MKTLSLILCLFLVGYGMYSAFVQGNTAGHVLVMVGGLSFCLIIYRTEKRADYNKHHWMNR